MRNHSRIHKSYPTWRQRDTRMLLFALAIGALTAAVVGGLIYIGNRMN